MKTKLLFLLMLAVCISCVNSNKPLTDSEKDKIIAEAKDFAATLSKSFADLDADKVGELYDSSTFFSFSQGKIVGHKEFVENLRKAYAPAKKFNFSIIDSKFVVLDRNTVLYSEISGGEASYKDSTNVFINPWYDGYVFKKINNSWKVVADVAYGHSELTRPGTVNAELNQFELYKKYWDGTWQSSRNDTVFTQTIKKITPNYLETVTKAISKGKLLYELRTTHGYNRMFDAILSQQVNVNTGSAIVVVQKFITPTKIVTIPFYNVNESQFSRITYEADYSTPGVREQKTYVNKKLVRTTVSKKID